MSFSASESLASSRVTLLELGDALVLSVQLGLATGLAPRERLAAVKYELLAPCRRVGTVDTLAAEQRLDLAALRAGCRLADNPQLLGRGENDRLLPRFGTVSTETPLGREAAPGAAGAGAGATEPRGGGSAATATPLGRGAAPGAAGAGSWRAAEPGGGSAATATPLGRGAAPGAAGAGLTDGEWEKAWARVRSILPPPSLHRFREEAVSVDVGTGGPCSLLRICCSSASLR